MKIPEDTNTRAEAMWRIISQRIDFRGKRVIDLGCGHGEMLWRAHVAGAKQVRGYDVDHSQSELVYETLQFTSETVITVACQDINSWVQKEEEFSEPHNFDIALCFSVLPYLNDIPITLQWMSKNFPLCLIEAQYEPELYNIGVPSDDQMYVLLRENGFKCATWLGETYVEDRDTHRSIWACSKGVVML